MTERLHFRTLEKEMATHSGVLAWRIPGTGVGAWWAAVCGVAQSRTRLDLAAAPALYTVCTLGYLHSAMTMADDVNLT